MHVINNINAKTFSYNGRNYTKNFIAIKQGNTNIAIHNAYDTKFQLVGSTHFNQFQVNGIVYTSQADLMANLVNILFVKNLGAGAISNTSELINDGADGINPFVTTADLPSANKILNQTGYNLSGETLTINADWVWLIANQQYTNDDVVEINVPLATSGNTRIDLIVADNNNTFQRIAGTEAVDNAIAPPVPNNTIQATLIVVSDGIIEVEPTPTGDLYLEKFDEGIGNLGSSSGIMANFILKKYTNYIIQNTSSVTQINSASFLSPVFSYVGKRIRITNQQSTPIVIKHNFGIGVLKFDLINNTDYILGSDETISFIVQDDYTLLHFAEINLENLPTPTLQEVTDAGNTTSNVIVGNNGFTTSDAHSNFEIATNYTTGTRQLNFYIEGDEVDFPTSTSAQISTNLDNGISFTSSVSGNTTGFFVNGFDQGVTIGGTSGKFALLKTGLISGGTKSFEFPNESGTLALTSDIPSLTGYVTTNTTQTITGNKQFNNVRLIDKVNTSLFPTESGGSFRLGGTGGYDSFDFYSVDGEDSDSFGTTQIYSNPEEGNVIRHTSLDNNINAILQVNQYDMYLRHSYGGQNTSIYIDGITDKVIIEGTQNKFAGLGTSLITGQKNFEFPNQSGTLSLKSDVDLKLDKIVQLTGETLSSSGWTLNGDIYEYEYSNSGITSTSIIDIIPSIASTDIITTALIYPIIESSVGTAKLFAKNQPTSAITVTINITNN